MTKEKLVSMKLPPREKSDAEVMYPSAGSSPEYPWGLCLTLEEDQLKALGITKMPEVGSTIPIVARATVSSVSEYESQENGERRSLSLQITDLGLG